MLGSLRALQRELDLAVLLVHHMRKSPSAHLGQQLRGSGDFAAWSDSSMYLVRDGPGDLVLSVEHRGAPAPPPLRVRLAQAGPCHPQGRSAAKQARLRALTGPVAEATPAAVSQSFPGMRFSKSETHDTDEDGDAGE